MFYESLFNPSVHRPVKACLTGAGEFGASFLFQAQGMPLLAEPAFKRMRKNAETLFPHRYIFKSECCHGFLLILSSERRTDRRLDSCIIRVIKRPEFPETLLCRN